MVLRAWRLPTEITITIIKYVLFKPYEDPDTDQLLDLLMVCQDWRFIIETFSFSSIWKTCITDDDVDQLCSTIRKDERVFHLRELSVDLGSLDATQCILAIRRILGLLSCLDEDKNKPHPGIILELRLRSYFDGCAASSQSAAIERDLLPPLPKINAIRELRVETWFNPNTVVIAKRLPDSAPRATDRAFMFQEMPREEWNKFTRLVADWPFESTKGTGHLFISKQQDPLYGKGTAQVSHIRWTIRLYHLSLGFKVLHLNRDTGAGIEIFGPTRTGSSDPEAEWPYLTEFYLDYDQCLVDMLKPKCLAELNEMACRGGTERLLHAYEVVWEAAAAAAQRMPKLERMSLISNSGIGPRFYLYSHCASLQCAQILCKWHKMADDGDWRPNRKLLAMWCAFAEKRGQKLKVLMNDKTIWAHRVYPPLAPECTD
ncbi:hypothetical protein PG984_014063 [Apiospora sp. TS-2023a]